MLLKLVYFNLHIMAFPRGIIQIWGMPSLTAVLALIPQNTPFLKVATHKLKINDQELIPTAPFMAFKQNKVHLHNLLNKCYL